MIMSHACGISGPLVPLTNSLCKAVPSALAHFINSSPSLPSWTVSILPLTCNLAFRYYEGQIYKSVGYLLSAGAGEHAQHTFPGSHPNLSVSNSFDD